MTDPGGQRFLRYVHLEKLYGHLPGLTEHLPAVFGLSSAAYEAAREDWDVQASRAAEVLLEAPGFRERVESLPFGTGETVLAVGDSITDDLASWAEILRHLLRLVRPGDRIKVVNGGLSAHTTAMVLRRWPATLVSLSPDWVICGLGGNDVTRVGPDATKVQVSLSESMANFGELRRIAGVLTQASWIWLTPVPVVPERAGASPAFQFGRSSWDNSDIVALAASMAAELDDPVVDLVRVFGVPARDDLQGDDGVHPTVDGQGAITAALVDALAEMRHRAG